MPVQVVPNFRLSANGASALVDTAGSGWRVCELPSGRVRWEVDEEESLDFGSLSASGRALAWMGEDRDLTVLSGEGRTTVPLPVSDDWLRAIAPSDAGDRVACLIGGESRLVIAKTGTGDEEAAVGVPVYDTGFILANDDCSLLVAGSFEGIGDQRRTGAYVRDSGELRPLWTEEMAPTAFGALAVYGEWIFAATAEGIAGWRRDGERVSVPGSMRERMIFSRDGRHLLVYRVDEVIEVTSARMHFRLIALPSLEEVRRTSHLIENRQGAQFVLDDELDLVEVRVTRAGELVVERLGWGAEGGRI